MAEDITPEVAKFYRDKHVMDAVGGVKKINKATATETMLGVLPENYDILAEEEGLIKKQFKEASQIFTNKIALAEKFYDKQPIYLDDSGSFWLWNTGSKSWFRIEREEDICNLVNDSIGIDTINSKERSEIMQALKQIGRRYAPRPLPSTWIQFKNGIVDIKNKSEVITATPKYFTVNPVPWNLGESLETPVMDKIFKEWVGEDKLKTLYQIIAYCLLPSYPLHRIFCFIGGGMNGKSKFMDLLRKFIGQKNCCATDLDVLLKSRFEVTRLHKKLVCEVGETNFSEISKTSLLKKLSGEDLIGLEYKNKTPFEEKNYAKIIIATNNLPTTSDKTIGFYRRWMIIDFPNQFDEKKDILEDIPESEYENLALKCVEILKELLIAKEFHNEGNVEERMKRYEDHSDPLEKFIKEFTEEDVNKHIWKFEFEKRLNEWCMEKRFRQISEVGIGKKMKEKGIEQALKMSDWFIDGQKKQIRAWLGIKWKQGLNEPLSQSNQDNQDNQVTTTRFSRISTDMKSPDYPAYPDYQVIKIGLNELLEKNV